MCFRTTHTPILLMRPLVLWDFLSICAYMCAYMYIRSKAFSDLWPLTSCFTHSAKVQRQSVHLDALILFLT